MIRARLADYGANPGFYRPIRRLFGRMDSRLSHLERDTERARRLLAGLNDRLSIRTLEEYAAELDGRLAQARNTRIAPDAI